MLGRRKTRRETEGDEDNMIMDNVQLDVTRLLKTLVHLYDIRREEVEGVDGLGVFPDSSTFCTTICME